MKSVQAVTPYKAGKFQAPSACVVLVLLLSVVLSASAARRFDASNAEWSKSDQKKLTGYKASILHFTHDPWKLAKDGRCPKDFLHQEECDHLAAEYFEEGLLIVNESGHVHALDDYKELIHEYPDIYVVNYTDSLIVPGFIDCHIHYPQTDKMASWGDELNEWLTKYIYPAESQYIDPEVAAKAARRFTNDMLRAGTTTANVYNVIFEDGVDALFREATKKNMRIISGLDGMANCQGAYQFNTSTSKNVPLCNSMDNDDHLGIKSSLIIKRHTEELIERWHNNGRLLYSVMPRFLTTATPASMHVYAELMREAPKSPKGLEVRFHTHNAENLDTSLESMTNFKELALQYYNQSEEVGDLQLLKQVMDAKTQLEVFDIYGLVNDKASFAHNIHLTYKDYDLMAHNGSMAREGSKMFAGKASSCHCPTSNLFLGSGLFDMQSHIELDVPFGVGTDIGGGTSYSLLTTLQEVYKVSIMGHRETANLLKPEPQPMYPGDPDLDPMYYFPVKKSYRLSPLKQMYLITKGTALQLGLDDYVGNFEVGKEADFVVIDKESSPVLNQRLKDIDNSWSGETMTRADKLNILGEKLLAVFTLSSQNTIKATYVMGEAQYLRHVNMNSDTQSDFRAEIVANAYGASVFDKNGHK